MYQRSMDLIGKNHCVVLLSQCGNFAKFFLGKYSSPRIMRITEQNDLNTGFEYGFDSPEGEETAAGTFGQRYLIGMHTAGWHPIVETVIYRRHNHHFAIRASIFAHQFGSYTRCVNMNADMLRIDWPVPPVLRKTCKCLAESVVGARISGIMAG